jgi:hypothetical protein
MTTSRGSGEPLADLDAALVEVEQVPKVEKIERRVERRNQIVVIVSLVIALLSMAWSTWNSIEAGNNSEDIAEITARATVNEKDIKDLREANKLRAEAGLPQIPLPEPGQEVDVKALAAAASALVLEDIQSDPRFRGPSGPRGEPGKPGKGGSPGQPTPEQLAQAVAAYCSQASQPCTGDQGPKGDKGDPGTDGAHGASVVAVQYEPQGLQCVINFVVIGSKTGNQMKLDPITLDVPCSP